MTTADHLDVLIIGAGPAGLAAACACQKHKLSHLIIDRKGLAQSFVEYPHSLQFFSPPDEMEIAGVPLSSAGGLKPTREIYLSYLRGVVRAKDIRLSSWRSVYSCRKNEEGFFELETRYEPSAGDAPSIRCKNIVVATGLWHKPNRIPCPGFDGQNVISEFTDPTPFCTQDVLIVGGGNSAVGAALSLMEARANVTLSMRRPPKNYRSGLRPFVKRDLGFAVEEKKIALLAETRVVEIHQDHAILEPVRYTGTEELSEGSNLDYEVTGDRFAAPCRFVFSLIGHQPDRDFLGNTLGLNLRPNGRPISSVHWECSVPGIYVAGSLADHEIDVVLTLARQARAVIATIAESRQ